MRFWKVLAAVALAGGLFSQTPSAPAAHGPAVELKGRIAHVQIAPGEGTPFIEVKTDGGTTTRVRLGPMRYLMEQNFNPRTDQHVTVKGYRVGNEVVAISVGLTAEKKLLRLRDENGWPVWVGYRHRAKKS